MVRGVTHGRPSEVHRVQSDDRSLEQTRAGSVFLHFGMDTDDADEEAKDQIEGDEEFMEATVTRGSVIHKDQNDGSDGSGIVEHTVAEMRAQYQPLPPSDSSSLSIQDSAQECAKSMISTS